MSWHGNAFGRPHRSAGAGPGLRVGAARAFAAGRRQNEYRAPRGCGRYSGTDQAGAGPGSGRSEEHTSELQSLMSISYAVFCLKKKNKAMDERERTSRTTTTTHTNDTW